MTTESVLTRATPVVAFALVAMETATSAGGCKPVLGAVEEVAAQSRGSSFGN